MDFHSIIHIFSMDVLREDLMVQNVPVLPHPHSSQKANKPLSDAHTWYLTNSHLTATLSTLENPKAPSLHYEYTPTTREKSAI